MIFSTPTQALPRSNVNPLPASSFSLPPSLSFHVCAGVWICVGREKSSTDRGKLKSLAARVSSRHKGLSFFCRSPPAKEGTFFFSSSFRWKAYYFPCSLSLSFSLVHTLAPFHILMPFKCHLFYMRYFVEMGNQEQSGLLSLWGDVGPDALRHPSSGWPLLQCATSRELSGIMGEVAVMGTAWQCR